MILKFLFLCLSLKTHQILHHPLLFEPNLRQRARNKQNQFNKLKLFHETVPICSAEILLFSFLLWPFLKVPLKLLNFELHMTCFYWTNNNFVTRAFTEAISFHLDRPIFLFSTRFVVDHHFQYSYSFILCSSTNVLW